MKKIIILTALAAMAIQTTIAGTITGIVTDDSTGLPIPDMFVYALSYDAGDYCNDSATNSNGVYCISGLAEGEYRIGISSWGINCYIEEYYDNTLEYENAEAVYVTSSGETQNIDFGLTMGGIISGRVIDPDGQPVEGVRVYAYDYATNLRCGIDFTDSEGFYSIYGLVAGAYRIEARPHSGSNYVMQYYNGQNIIDNASPVVVGTGGIVEDINFQLALGSGISGEVTGPDGQPVADVLVYAYEYETYQLCGSDRTNSEGLYSITGLATGAYRVMADPDQDSNYVRQFYDDKDDIENATPVAIHSAGAVVEGINFQLATGGSIRGMVVDPNGQPVANVQVRAYDYATRQYCDSGITDSEGLYSISGLAMGTYYLDASPDPYSNYVNQYYNGQDDRDNATPVVVNPGDIVEDINFQLVLGGSIRGIVIDPNGLPIVGVQVSVYDYAMHQNSSTDWTDSDGRFSFHGLAEGSYRVVAHPGPGSNYVSQYYNGQDDWENATPVMVNPGGIVEDVNFQFVIGGGISGIVTDPNGLPIANIQVSVQTNDGSYGFSAATDADGMYEIGGLPDGLYRVHVWADETIYASMLYDNTIAWEQATLVSVLAGQWTTGIDFSLELGATVSGVVKNSSGIGQANIDVNCGGNNWATTIQTDTNGYYEVSGLPVGYTYKLTASAPPGSDYIITRITVDVFHPGVYANQDIILNEGAIIISGKVTDKATTLPLENIGVSWWNDDLEIGDGAVTDADGTYTLNLLSGRVDISIWPISYYAQMGIGGLDVQADISNLDFALPPGATLYGKVIDAQTAHPLVGVVMEYSNDTNAVSRGYVTDTDGSFYLTQLPPGIAEVKAKPAVDSGHAWNLPDGGDFVCLDEGENRTGRMIALEQGALVSGYMKDAAGNPLGDFEYYYSGRDSDGGGVTDINGFYQMRLPVGSYFITVENNEEFGAVPAIVTVTDFNENINVPDINVFTDVTGSQVSGQISNPGPYAKMGVFTMVAFKAGTLLNDPDLWYTAQPAVVVGMENAGPFSLNKLPSGANYDIYLCVNNQTPDIESLTIRDSVLNVAPGTIGITLEYNSQGVTVTGTVINTDGYPVLGATVILWGSSGFSGFTQTDCGGQYALYNVPAGTYTATAIRSKYHVVSTSLEVVDGVTADADDMVMPFEGNKEGPDLNGDGKVNMDDLAAFAGQWLHSGTSQADFNQDSEVELSDWSPIAENWLSKAIWYNE